MRSGQEAWLAAPNAFGPRTATAVLLYHTTNAGRIWQRLPTLFTGPYSAGIQVQFIDAVHGWLWITCGANMMQIAFDIYRTADGGRRWQHVLSESDANAAAPVRPPIGGGLPTCDCMQGMTFLTLSTGWVAGCYCGIGTWHTVQPTLPHAAASSRYKTAREGSSPSPFRSNVRAKCHHVRDGQATSR